MKLLVPNIFTISNLLSGTLAIIAVFNGNYHLTLWLTVAALVFDFLDGLLARLLRVHSEMGKQLDSLADMVTFGVLPGLFVFHLLEQAQSLGSEPVPGFLPYIGLLIPAFTALRLAKFNLDERQTEHFIGLPSPASAFLIISLCFWGLTTKSEFTRQIILHPFLMTIVTIGSSLLLVAELPLLSLKIKNLSWRENRGRFLLVLLAAIIILVFRFRALAFIVPLYLLLSLIFKPKK